MDVSGAHAQDANHYVIYDRTTGNLPYDADGSGAGAAITFAHLPAGLDLSNLNFYVI